MVFGQVNPIQSENKRSKFELVTMIEQLLSNVTVYRRFINYSRDNAYGMRFTQ